MSNKVQIKVRLGSTGSKVYDYRFYVPDELAEQFIDGKDRRIICTFDTFKKYCALMPSPEGYYILADKKLRKNLQLEVGQEIKVTIEKDESKYGMPVAEEFAACLELDPEAQEFFEALSPGKQRSLLHIVGKIKSADIRARRSLAILDHLKRDANLTDYKGLNQTIKEFNQRENLF
ncbi:MAG: YdeI/OmpD-associated family protein [Vicingaceae bacterium]